MKFYTDYTREELNNEKEALLKSFSDLKALNLSLDMTRGKPAPVQLDISSGMFDDIYAKTNYKSEDGTDCRNYGVLTGIPEAKRLFAQVLNTVDDNIFIGNSSSLNLMFDTLMRAMVFGEIESTKPWLNVEGRKWICPAPGYDRHFRITEKLGFELVTVKMNDDGPDMDEVERLVSSDDKILGMWCVPLYSNPDGIVYSEKTCKRIASMKCAASDFRVYWDNAYVVHHLYDDKQESIPDILSLAEECGNPNRFYEFASTSKITFAGAGLSCFAANKDNMEFAKKMLGTQTIGSNKVVQLCHASYLKDINGLTAVMRKHADILRPKFQKILEVLDRELSDKGVAKWKNPLGGYFISVYVFPGTANNVVTMCKELGVSLTPAGATYPYGIDPDDSNIRLSPSFPSIADLEKATEVFTLCVRLAAVNKLLND